MQQKRWLILVAVFFAMTGWVMIQERREAKPVEQTLRIAIFTGGHDFERDEFFAVFQSFANLHWEEHQQPKANELWVGEKLKDYDAVILYDMWQEITEEQKNGMVRWLKDKGKGLVALHHSIASYQKWDEYARIIGGRFFIEPGKAPDGKEFARSQVSFDVHFIVKVLDKKHPITKGLPETFEIVDETYKGFWIAQKVRKLLGTDHELSEPCLAWANRYGKAKVVYIQMGHGPTAYRNPRFRTLVNNAIRWVAAK